MQCRRKEREKWRRRMCFEGLFGLRSMDGYRGDWGGLWCASLTRVMEDVILTFVKQIKIGKL